MLVQKTQKEMFQMDSEAPNDSYAKRGKHTHTYVTTGLHPGSGARYFGQRACGVLHGCMLNVTRLSKSSKATSFSPTLGVGSVC